MRNKIITAADAARLIPDDAVICIGSSAGLNCPDHMLAAIGENTVRLRGWASCRKRSPIAASM
jgi:acyl CoA:acetate/3-ketoacid CoA transferase